MFNTSGEKFTVRERLERHRDEPTCASCHATLDPYGLALENYDAIGKGAPTPTARTSVAATSPNFPANSQADAPSARWRSSSVTVEKDAFARAFTERMLTYALCRPVGYVDNREVSQILDTLKKNHYRIRALLEAIVFSEAFQTK